MRKTIIFTICLLALAAVNAAAQWKTSFHEADELKDTPEYYSNLYVAESGNAFVCWNNDSNVKIVTDRGIFDYDDNYVYVIVGFYENGKMTDKVTTKFFVPDGASSTAYSSDFKCPGLGERIKDHLKNTGSVRILASKYSGADFDITIPKYSELK